MRELTVGKVAERAGVGVETVRFYERKGLVEQPSKPRSGGFRVYPQEVVRRIRFIRKAQELGFSLREINELLVLQNSPLTECGDVRERAEIKLDEIDHKIAELKRIRGVVKQLIAECPGEGGLEVCAIINALITPEDPAGDGH